MSLYSAFTFIFGGVTSKRFPYPVTSGASHELTYTSITNKNTQAWAVSQHIDTSKNTKAWAVPQHTDTSKNTKATLKCCDTLHSY